MPRTKASLLIGAGIVSAGLLGLTGTGTLSAISAQVLNQPNSIGFGRMVLELRSGGEVCRSSDDVTDVFTCQTIQPLSGRDDVLPGEEVTTEVVAVNRGSVEPSAFTLGSGGCVPMGHPTDERSKKAFEVICDQVRVLVQVDGEPVFTGSARELGEQTLAIRVPKRDEKVAVSFTAATSKELGDAVQGLGVSMPMTWTFQQ